MGNATLTFKKTILFILGIVTLSPILIIWAIVKK